MIFHGNRLLADDSHEISYLIFFRKLRKMSQNLSSAAVVIGALRIKVYLLYYICIRGSTKKIVIDHDKAEIKIIK